LAAAFKRVVNIIKDPEAAPVDPGLFQNDSERVLFTTLKEAEQVVQVSTTANDFDGALTAMTRLKDPIDAFFESVLVMDKYEAIRRNRLALLTRTRDLFNKVADFRKIQTA
jgi:glycyl-tRNA synthetase beta chain